MAVPTALVVGASRGIGAALVRVLADESPYRAVYAVARSEMVFSEPAVVGVAADAGDEAAMQQLARRIAAPIDLLVHCVGVLDVGPRTPEKSLSDIDGGRMLASFSANVLPAALVLKVFAGHLKRADGAQVVVLSAKVGSITDNRLGGWYGYRASKAALNQVVRTAAIELGRHGTCVVAVHPGTTHTDLSDRFVARRDGVASADVTARRIVDLVTRLRAEDGGTFLNWDGSTIPW